MRVLDLFSGLGGWSQPFAERGHEVVTVDIEERFEPTYVADVLEWEPEGEYDIVLASPPCERFSVAGRFAHWRPGYEPATDAARVAIRLVARTVELVEYLAPAFWVIENPVGMLRKLGLLPYEKRWVTYCQYGEPRRKPTDLWGGFPPSLVLWPPCRNGNPCHEPAPRGSRSGTQGMSAAEAALIPRALALDVCLSAERDFAAGRRAADYTGRLFA